MKNTKFLHANLHLKNWGSKRRKVWLTGLAHVTIILMSQIVLTRAIHLDLKVFIRSYLPHMSFFLTLWELPMGRHRRTLNGGVSPNSVIYLWCSEAVRITFSLFENFIWLILPASKMFLTQLLFSSPQLWFSEAQKSAILRWAKDLKAPDVPTLSALKRSSKWIIDLVGNPTGKVMVTSASGKVFYLNYVGKAISKVCGQCMYYLSGSLIFLLSRTIPIQ